MEDFDDPYLHFKFHIDILSRFRDVNNLPLFFHLLWHRCQKNFHKFKIILGHIKALHFATANYFSPFQVVFEIQPLKNQQIARHP